MERKILKNYKEVNEEIIEVKDLQGWNRLKDYSKDKGISYITAFVRKRDGKIYEIPKNIKYVDPKEASDFFYSLYMKRKIKQ